MRVARYRTVAMIGLWLVGLFTVLASAGPQDPSTAGAVGQANFQYTGAASAVGDLRGTCIGYGINFPANQPGGFTFHADQVDVMSHDVYVNGTRAQGVWIDGDFEWTESVTPAPSGTYHVAWTPPGRAMVFPYGAHDMAVETQDFDVSFNTSRMQLSGLNTNPVGAGDIWLKSAPDHLGRAGGAFPGLSRNAQFAEPVNVSGNASIHLASTSIQFPDGGRVDLPPWSEETQTLDLVVGQRVNVHYRETWLLVRGFETTVDPANALTVCGAVSATGTGTWTAAAATGTADVEQRPFEFTGKVVSLSGHLQWSENMVRDAEQPWRGYAQTQTEGPMQAFGVDFQTWIATPQAPAGATIKVAGVTALLAGAVAWLATKTPGLVGAYYARFGPDKALTHPRRRQIRDLLASRPGLNVKDVAQELETHRNSVRYHIGVLVRTGIIHAASRGRYCLVKDGRPRIQEGSASAALGWTDERVSFVRQRLSTGPRTLKSLCDEIAQRFNVSIRSARRIVVQSEREGLVQRTVVSGRGAPVVVECVA